MGVQACAHTAGMREEKRRSLGVHSERQLSDTGKEKETSPPSLWDGRGQLVGRGETKEIGTVELQSAPRRRGERPPQKTPAHLQKAGV